MNKIYIIHENDTWMRPFREAFRNYGIDYEEWNLSVQDFILDLNKEPPQGIFYNRVSPSSHTRGNRFAPEYAAVILKWLESFDRKVINGSFSLRVEISKVEQYLLLKENNINVPRTIVLAFHKNWKKTLMRECKNHFPNCAFIIKHNRGGKGTGVHFFASVEDLEIFNFEKEEEPIDGTVLLQEFIECSEKQTIYRVEFVGGKHLYTLEVDASQGFALCPFKDELQSCPDDVIKNGGLCPVNNEEQSGKFKIVHNVVPESLLRSYLKFLKSAQVDIAAIEFIKDKMGRLYTYDVNMNTNYNRGAEMEAFGSKECNYAVYNIISFLLKN